MQNIHKNETSISILYINTNFRQNFTFSKQTITASYERKAAIYAVLFSFRKHRNSSCTGTARPSYIRARLRELHAC